MILEDIAAKITNKAVRQDKGIRVLGIDKVEHPMNVRFIDRTGQRYGKLRVLWFIGKIKKHPYWLVECDCGCVTSACGTNLTSGQTTSCGCETRSKIGSGNTTHGSTVDRVYTPEYTCWVRMRQRCLNPDNLDYHIYGGRGIRICERWLDGEGGLTAFECFFADMGARPSDQHSIERKDVDGNYEPINCEWTTKTRQSRNMRKTIRVTWDGQEMPLMDACELLGLDPYNVRDRMGRYGWSFYEAATIPKNGRRRK